MWGNRLWFCTDTTGGVLLFFYKANKMHFITKQHLLLGKQLVINHCWACAGLVYNTEEQSALICLPPNCLPPAGLPPAPKTKRQIGKDKPQPWDSRPSA